MLFCFSAQVLSKAHVFVTLDYLIIMEKAFQEELIYIVLKMKPQILETRQSNKGTMNKILVFIV